MNINSLYFPYPVLSNENNDYLGSFFDVSYDMIEKGFNSQSIQIKFQLDDRKIEDMIEKNQASMMVHIECSVTSFRKLYRLDQAENEIEIRIDPDKMRDKVEISSFILLNEDIEEYRNDSINKLIYGENYRAKNLERGNILAAVYTQDLQIEVDTDDFEKISSIIRVGQSKDKFLEVDLDGEIILVKMPKKQHEQYVKLSGGVYSDVIMTSTILPVLVHVLDMLGDSKNLGTYSDLTWYRVIKSKLSLKDINIEDINDSHSSLKLAQMILESPLERALDSIQIEVEREEN